MNAITEVYSDEGDVRVILIDRVPHFVGRDVCGRLGCQDATTAIKRHCKGVPKYHPLETAGGLQQVRVLGESDLMRLIVGSALPAAERFERLVFEKILPEIRRTGSYSSQPVSQSATFDFNDSRAVIRLIEAQARKAIAEGERADAAQEQVAELGPRAAALDELASSDGSMSVSEAAKLLNIGQRRLFAYLASKKWVYRRTDSDGKPGRWLAYAEMLERGWMENCATSYVDRAGERVLDRQVRVTAAGLARLAFLFKKFGPPP